MPKNQKWFFGFVLFINPKLEIDEVHFSVKAQVIWPGAPLDRVLGDSELTLHQIVKGQLGLYALKVYNGLVELAGVLLNFFESLMALVKRSNNAASR